MILVVDDDETMRDTVRDLLEDAGYTVETCADGLEALAALLDGPEPCLLLLDLKMPNLSGQELLALMAPDPEYSQIPVVILSGMPLEVVWSMLECGANMVIHKDGGAGALVLAAAAAYC